MPTNKSTPASDGAHSLSRRQVLGAAGAAVSYAPPLHDHRKAGVNLQALRDMTAQVAKERPDFICYPEGCTCVAGGFERGVEIAPELGPYVAEVGKLAREFNTAIFAPTWSPNGQWVLFVSGEHYN